VPRARMFGPDDESFVERTHPTGRHLKRTMLTRKDNAVKGELPLLDPHYLHRIIHAQRNSRTISIRRNKI